MDSTKHLVVSVVLAVFIVFTGAAGYMMIEGWDLLDSIYMTVITLGTVGYGEVHRISRVGRIYTIFLIIIGVGFLGYVAGGVIQFMVEGRIRNILGRRRLDKKIDRLKDHYIVCGYGRIGRVICKGLGRKPLELVAVEKSEELIPVMEQDGVLYVSGEATNETTLLKAGIKNAKGLVAVLGTDIDNVFLVLTARQLNPTLMIIARAGSKESEAKLEAAGANTVESPYEMGAVSMAQRILRPTVTNFLDLAFSYKRSHIQMEEIPVGASSELVNIPLKDSGIRQNYNLIIIAIKKADGSMLFNPSFETVIKPGDTVIAVGEEKNLKRMEKALNP